MQTKIIAGIILLLFGPMAMETSAQHEIIVTGKVIGEGGKPVPFANVVLHGSSDSTFITGSATDDAGVFTLRAAPGKYYVKISFLSFDDQIINDVVINDKNIDLGTITLSAGTKLLNAVEVTGERAAMELQLDKRIFNVDKDLSNIGGNAADILNNIPSVSVDVDGSVSLRGSANVRIFINGKPSALTSRDPDALRQLQSSMVERVEVITNPSARYDASGEVGIINIVLKKNQEKGINGVFTGSAGHPDFFASSYRLNIRKKDFNFFTSYGFDYHSNPGYSNSKQIYGNDSSDIRTNKRIRSERSHNIMGGVDYFFDDKTSITGSFMANISDGLNTSVLTYENFANGNPTSTSVRTDREIEDEYNIEAAINFKKEFEQKDKVLTADLQYIDGVDDETSDFFQTSDENALTQRSVNNAQETNALLQIDFVNPFAKDAKFETGIRSTYRVVDNDFLLEALTGENTWQSYPEFNNHFIYNEMIHAGYVMAGKKFNKLSGQLGLRGEFSDIETELVRTNETNPRSYFNLFPSVNFGYEFNQNKTLQFSYSKRINRPRFRNLLPFSNFTDPRVFFMGNPDLNPEFVHAFEVGYLVNWESGSILSSVYYRNKDGVIQRITQIDSANISRIMPVNLSSENAYGLEFNVSGNLSKWWQVNLNANFFRQVTSGEYEDQNFYSDAYTFTTRTSTKITFFQSLEFQASFNYRAPRNEPQGRELSSYSVDLSLGKDVLKGKGTITANVRDLLNTRLRRSITDLDNYYSESVSQWRPRQFRVTFTYRLNQKKERERSENRENDGEDF